VARVDDLLSQRLSEVGTKPADDASRATKQNYSQRVSNEIAIAFAEELRQRGLSGALPGLPVEGGTSGRSGAERRMAGGIGAKKVDVSWSTDESGLLLALSVKTINFRDRRSGNFQKNLTNRRGDLLFESVTLHRRFPYATLGGFLFLDKGAATDDTDRRQSTFNNAHTRLKLFTGRDDTGAPDEQYERLYVCLLDADPPTPEYSLYEVGAPDSPVSAQHALDELMVLVAERNSDFYEWDDNQMKRL